MVYDVPLLAEQGLSRGARAEFDAVVVVVAPLEARIARLMGRGVSEAEAVPVAAQASDDERLAVADHVVDNTGDLAALDVTVDRLWSVLVG